MKPNISAFFPAYNEEKNIANTVHKAKAVLEQLAGDYEILVINDGSSDQTLAVARGLEAEFPKVKVINHEINRGYGGALKSGFYNARYEWVAFTDSDGQFDFSELSKLLEKSSDSDLVVGYRLKRVEGFIRKLNARLWGILIWLVFGLRVKDIDCAFKLIKRDVFDRIPKLESNGALISAELLIRCRKADLKIAQVGVHHYPRLEGNPTGANLNVIIKAFKELL
ncbi:glycosyltransferase family 2 protein, partial [candidate division WWE3 bacterium CG08_land_8_20_14_0_20_43_13]